MLRQIILGAAVGLVAGLLDALISRGRLLRPGPAERAVVLDALAAGCETAEEVREVAGLTRRVVAAALGWLVGRGLVEAIDAHRSEVGRGRPPRRYRVVGLAALTGAGRERLDRELAEAARRARERTWRRRRGSFPDVLK